MKNKFTKKFTSCFEISILVLAVFAFSFFLAPQKVSAAKLMPSCCMQTKTGLSCQEYTLDNCFDNCAGNCIPTACSEVTECKLGCCQNSEGVCQENTPRKLCSANSNFFEDANCNVNECNSGCCFLGLENKFTTRKNCEILSSFSGYQTDFRLGLNELECIDPGNLTDEGACIISGNCRFMTKQQCLSIPNSNYYNRLLCSNPKLNTNCTKQATTNCVEGKDEVYWFDSCGNRENIYDADKTKSWNSGKVLDKEESCNPDSNNAVDSSCGNCNRYKGSFCKPAGSFAVDFGEYICKEDSCNVIIAGKQVKKKNGESWCVFESQIGDGKDVVGSRHYKYSCIQGEVKIESCADFRQEVCVEQSEADFTFANCRLNNWRKCFDKADSVDCYSKTFRVSNDLQFTLNLPKYPSGFDFWNEDSGKEYCSVANLQCEVTYKKEGNGPWQCIHNCECKTSTFASEINDLCRRLGDCGMEANVAGKVTENYLVSNSPRASASNLASFAKLTANQKVDVEPMKNLPASVFINKNSSDSENAKQAVEVFGKISGSMGVLAATTFLTNLGVQQISSGTIAAVSSNIAAFSSAAAAISLGALLSLYIADTLGVQNSNAALVIGAVSATSAVIDIIVSTILFPTVTLPGLQVFLAPLGTAIIAGVIISLFFIITGTGKISYKTETVAFQCLPWTAPLGGADCHLCNDPAKPCSEYKCKSLGQCCGIINQGTEDEICAEICPNEIKPPVLSPLYPQEYQINEVDNGYTISNNGNCLPNNKKIEIGVQADEFAQCKYSLQPFEDFENMQYFNLNTYKKNHTTNLNFLPLEHLSSILRINQNITFQFYIKCQDSKGNKNLRDYSIVGCLEELPDSTPPEVLGSVPADNSYLAEGTSQTFFKLMLNEPAECKFSKEDKIYSRMENTMECANNIFDYSHDSYAGLHYECNTTLSGLFSGSTAENKFYFKCKDQPWLSGENESKRNTNIESYSLDLRGSGDLVIESITPTGVVESSSDLATVNIEAVTSAGSENGISECKYTLGNSGFIDFFSTNSVIHKQSLQLVQGSYTVYVRCSDSANNLASGFSDFIIEKDTTPPAVVKAYNENSKLKLVTNENAVCSYTTKTCNFDFSNATSMINSGKTHYADWQTNEKYYIKCKDNLGNIPSECSIIIKAY